MKLIQIVFVLLLSLSTISIFGKKMEERNLPIENKNGTLIYTADSLGNQVPDFSFCGYMAGDKPIPTIEVKAVVAPIDGDATQLIQKAIDEVSKIPINLHGFRGAVLLQSGKYYIAGHLTLHTSGVVLRGCGMGDNGTELIATGIDRRTLIQISGTNDRVYCDTTVITDTYVPVNGYKVTLKKNMKLKAGDSIVLVRPSTQEWINKLGTNHFGGGITALGWKPGDKDIFWDRTITSINGNTITLDAPITTALDRNYGGAYVMPYVWKGRIQSIGIENISCVSEFDTTNAKDEYHSWTAIGIENAKDVWVRDVTFKHFAGSAVYVLETAKRITVENCKSLAPVSEIGGERRNTFITLGQQCLFQRLYAEQGYHDFAVGYCAPGPNAFVQCYSERPYSFSGSINSWASGVLFDGVTVNGEALCYKNMWEESKGAGWNAANSVFWNCAASAVDCFAPPTAQNWAFGVWSQFRGDGYWNNSNNHIQPQSLFYAQLKARLGDQYTEDRAFLLPLGAEASSSPSIAMAQELTAASVKPAVTLSEWIDHVVLEHPISVETGNAPLIHLTVSDQKEKKSKEAPLVIKNGWLVRSNNVQTGLKYDVPWWNGSVMPSFLKKDAKPHITRFVPGRTGTGLTDNIDSVGAWMKENNIIALSHNYGLWYERRRDDHERIRRINSNVWPPFYEQPFARGAAGLAYDGLSKYDLTKFNKWYWMRLKQFADIADQKGLILLHQNYFQHNIIEAGAHWVDCPWRPANNINHTEFPEPVPFAGDKRLFLAEQFYDETNATRRKLHTAYIRQCLNNFKENNSVIQMIGEEFTGPLHFVQFWFDVILDWEKETGKKELIGLSTTKDVQDSILSDELRSPLVDVIDIKYWFYRNDGTTYAPQGGLNLAPRQFARLTKPGTVSFESVYRAVAEYRLKYPQKAVTYSSVAYPQQAWAVFMASGSLAGIPHVASKYFLQEASDMRIISEQSRNNQFVLGNKKVGYIIYAKKAVVDLDMSGMVGVYNVYSVDVKNGAVNDDKQRIRAGKLVHLNTAVNRVLWISKK